MVINGEGYDILKCKQHQLETVTTYEYLGSVISKDENLDAEVTRKRHIAICHLQIKLYWEKRNKPEHKNKNMQCHSSVKYIICVRILGTSKETRIKTERNENEVLRQNSEKTQR